MPHPPDNAKNQAGGKKAKPPAYTVDTVCMPAEFLDDGSDSHKKPCWKYPGAKRKFGRKIELFRTVSEKQGNGLSQEYDCKRKQKNKGIPSPMDTLKVGTGKQQFFSHLPVGKNEYHRRYQRRTQADDAKQTAEDNPTPVIPEVRMGNSAQSEPQRPGDENGDSVEDKGMTIFFKFH